MVRVGALEIALDRNFHLGGAANAELLGCSWGVGPGQGSIAAGLGQVSNKTVGTIRRVCEGWLRVC